MVPELTVQVVNYDTAAYLRPCLTSLLEALAQTPVPSQVMVLDNGSSDDLSGIEAEFGAAVAVLSSPENLGFGGGQNLLASRHAAPLICCVNPDVVTEQRDVFVRLLDALQDPAVAVAGPLLRTPDGAPQRWDHGELRGLRARVANGAGHAHWQPRTERTEVAWVSGAFLLVRRSAFGAAGGFDEGFFLYKEEEDLCLRIRRAGGRVLYCPDAAASHVGGVVAGRDPRHLEASVQRYRAKHVPGLRGRAYELLYRGVTRRI
ncbi:MAG: glycosyltransferase family 2 protein [Solirubrobacteraceae bacterium]